MKSTASKNNADTYVAESEASLVPKSRPSVRSGLDVSLLAILREVTIT